MKLNKNILLLLLLACAATAQGQWRGGCGMPQPPDTLLPRWEPHLNVGTGFVSATHGDNRLFTAVAPSLAYHASDRLSLFAGFSILSDLGLNPNYNVGRSYAPRRSNGGTGLVTAEAGGEYRLSENVWLAASLWHTEGQYAPLFGPLNGNAVAVSATAISAAAAFRFKNDNILHLSLTFVRDRAGTLPWMCHDAWMHSGFGWSDTTPPCPPFGTPLNCGGGWWR